MSRPLLLELPMSWCQLMANGHLELFAAPFHAVAAAMLSCEVSSQVEQCVLVRLLLLF